MKLDDWPNCAVPDCAYKICTWLGGKFCYPHALGRTPPDPGKYFGRNLDLDQLD